MKLDILRAKENNLIGKLKKVIYDLIGGNFDILYIFDNDLMMINFKKHLKHYTV